MFSTSEMARHRPLVQARWITFTHSFFFLSFVYLLIKCFDEFSQLSDSRVCGFQALCLIKFSSNFFQNTLFGVVNCVLVSNSFRQLCQFNEFVFKPNNWSVSEPEVNGKKSAPFKVVVFKRQIELNRNSVKHISAYS